MSLIDWSDPEEMLGLLIEYVADETSATDDDADRASFLHELSRELGALAEQDVESDRVRRMLQEIYESQPTEFANDPVMAHLKACIEELSRIQALHRRRDLLQSL